MFAPIDVQHAAAEGHLREREGRGSGEGKRGERGAVRVGFFTYRVAIITKATPLNPPWRFPAGWPQVSTAPLVGRDKPTAVLSN